MPQIKPLLDAYIDANLLLILAFAVWAAMVFCIGRSRWRTEYLLQLRLTEGLMVAALLSPLLAMGFAQLVNLLFPGRPLSMADIAVAQFLDGRVQMEAVEFESLLGIRQSFVENLVHLRSPLAIGLAAFLIAGFAVCLLHLTTSILRLRRLIGQSYGWRQFGSLELRLSDRITVPFSTRGIFRRYIVVPTTMLAHPKALHIALSHELQHMRRWDIEWELVLALLQPFFFWNPVFSYWRQRLEHLREMGCDQALMSRKRITPRDYADCLLSVCEQSMKGVRGVTPKVALLDIRNTLTGHRNTRSLTARITAIATGTMPYGRSTMMLWSLLLVAAIAITVGASTLRKPGDWSQDRLMLSTIVNLERLEQRNSGLSLAGY